VISKDLVARTVAILQDSPALMQVLERARSLRLADWMVFSGAIYQPVLNHLTGRPPTYGLKDYDLGYFDGSDLSYEAEDMVIRRAYETFRRLCATWWRCETRRVCTCGSRATSAGPTRPLPARQRR
jgi:hypothetical protein